jgi:Rha family phage regulatory protein
MKRRDIKPTVVFFESDNAWTSSLVIAKVFGKDHDDVLKAIRNLECDSEFRAVNFAGASHKIDMPNGASRNSPYYKISRDGCMFLIMGFTGSKAAFWKQLFIEQFNTMEKKLREKVKIEELISEVPKMPITMLGFTQLSYAERKKQCGHFHEIMRGLRLSGPRCKQANLRIKMCAAVNLIVNGISSYRFRQQTGITGKTRDWLPLANQYALYRAEFDLLQICGHRKFQMTIGEVESLYISLAQQHKEFVEQCYQLVLHDVLLDHVNEVIANVRQQLDDDKISPYQLTEDQLVKLMEDRAKMIFDLEQQGFKAA